MCGIASIFKLAGTPCAARVVEKMRDEVAHRGPNDRGLMFFTPTNGGRWAADLPTDMSWTVGLGHRRLSIIDLSSAGHQPMCYRNRYWIVYNGELYNYIELRQDLQRLGHAFRSSSDTEVILAAYAEWGPQCFSRFRGMWGLALLDLERREAILCRDRIGIKPLYLWHGKGLLAVASEIKQFRHVPDFRAALDSTTGAEFLRTGYEDPARTFFVDVRPHPSGTWQRIALDTLKAAEPEPFWHPERIRASVFDSREAARLFGEKLKECVRIHLRSDVPVGCALSGGLDSSSLAVLVNAVDASGDPLHTFTSTFPGEAIDEREFVDDVLVGIKAVPHFVTPDPAGFLEDLNKFIWIHDEPVGSLSMYAGYCVARKTREAGVPVTLNGQGGDEVLSGYWQCYFLHLLELARKGRVFPLLEHFGGALFGGGNPSLVGQVPTMWRRYRARKTPSVVRLRYSLERDSLALLQEIMHMDGQARRLYDIRSMFLPRLLKWEDRNSMAFSVEGRYPFLDHELIELCLSFAPETLYWRGWTKWPLRTGLQVELPNTIRWRRSKFGFETPQDKWLVGPFRPELERWLKGDRPVWAFVEREDVRRVAEQTWRLQGRREEPGQVLFRLFVFDRWLEVFGLVC
jgi:asparagine synthase (glutamine-hydrolysing)